MENEIWKQINGFDNYSASSFGKIRNNTTKKILTGINNGNGYLFVVLSDRKHYYIHRLIAFAFIRNPENKPQINHKNGIKTDNRVENLEWATNSENQKHSYLIGTKKAYDRNGDKNPRFKHGNKTRINQPKNCEFCGNIFIAKFITSQYCNKLCSGRDKIKNMNEKRLSYQKIQATL